MIKSNFLNILKKYNKQIGHRISLREFCRLTKISRSTASNLFHGNSKGFTFDTLDKLVNFFQLPPSSFVTYTKGKPIILNLVNSLTPRSYSNLTGNRSIKSIALYSSDCPFIKLTFTPINYRIFNGSPQINIYYELDTKIMDYYLQHLRHSKKDLKTLKMLIATMMVTQSIKYKLNKLVDHLPMRLKGYLVNRILVHSGILSIDKSNLTIIFVPGHVYRGKNARKNNLLLNFGNAYTFHYGLLHTWKRQPIEYNSKNSKYRLITSKSGQIIKIHDYTTNNFAKK